MTANFHSTCKDPDCILHREDLYNPPSCLSYTGCCSFILLVTFVAFFTITGIVYAISELVN